MINQTPQESSHQLRVVACTPNVTRLVLLTLNSSDLKRSHVFASYVDLIVSQSWVNYGAAARSDLSPVICRQR